MTEKQADKNAIDGYLLIKFREPFPAEPPIRTHQARIEFTSIKAWDITENWLKIYYENRRVYIPRDVISEFTVFYNTNPDAGNAQHEAEDIQYWFKQLDKAATYIGTHVKEPEYEVVDDDDGHVLHNECFGALATEERPRNF